MHAAIVLQKAWRGVLAKKFAARGRDVEVFQRMARGWAVRRRMARMSRFGYGGGPSGCSRVEAGRTGYR